MKKVIVLAALFLLSGCGSIAEHSKGCYREYYQGTQKNHRAWDVVLVSLA